MQRLFSVGIAAVLPAGLAATGPHGYRSSEAYLPRVPVLDSLPTGEELVEESQLPRDFDWRDVGGRSWVTTDWNQHIPVYCGACWIHGTAHALNDRIKIMRGGRFPDVMLSRQALLNCVPDGSGQANPGCNGGDAWMIHKYMHENRVPDESCMPYVGVNQECAMVNVCRNCYHNETIDANGHPFFTAGPCFGIDGWTGYGVKSYGSISGESAMMKEIFARGPIVCSAATDDTFLFNYSTNEGIVAENVYVTDFPYTKDQIDHLMEVAGWGVTASGTKYWVVRNSWGTYWGDLGWVKIRRGVNQMQIESGCDWAVPDVHEVDEQSAGVVMGNYRHGIVDFIPSRAPQHAESLRRSAASAGAVLGLAVAPAPASHGPLVAVALTSVSLGAVMGAALMRAQRPRLQQPKLLG